MINVYWDIESFSQCSLKERGVYNYASDPSTNIHFLCYAVGNDDVQVWKAGDPIPEPFVNPATYNFVSDNWEFERVMHAQVLVKRYGFPAIPIENQDCAQRLALASAYPAELGLRCEALGLPYRKDPDARKAMLRLSRPQTGRSASSRKILLLVSVISRCCWGAARMTFAPSERLIPLRDCDHCCQRNVSSSCSTLR